MTLPTDDVPERGVVRVGPAGVGLVHRSRRGAGGRAPRSAIRGLQGKVGAKVRTKS